MKTSQILKTLMFLSIVFMIISCKTIKKSTRIKVPFQIYSRPILPEVPNSKIKVFTFDGKTNVGFNLNDSLEFFKWLEDRNIYDIHLNSIINTYEKDINNYLKD